MSKQQSIFEYRSTRSSECPTVCFDADDQKRIAELVDIRQRGVCETRGKSNVNCDREPDETERCGIKGELAMCQYYGLDPTEQAVTEPGHDEYDIRVTRFGTRFKQTTVDVKATPLSPAWLKHLPHRELTADIYVLAHTPEGRSRTVLVGWATREELQAREPRQTVAGCTLQNKNHVLRSECDELHRMPEQWEVAE